MGFVTLTTPRGRGAEEPLTGREAEALRLAFARLRALAATAPEGDRHRLRAACRGLSAPGEGASRAERILTERELDVLAHAATGLRNDEIAEALRLGQETVKSYLRSTMGKLGAHNRQEAVLVARTAGLLP